MHYKAQILACDFFTVETFFLQTAYVLFFIELQTRRVDDMRLLSNKDRIEDLSEIGIIMVYQEVNTR